MKRRLVPAIAGVAACAVVLFAVPFAVVLQRNYTAEALLGLQRDTVAATRGIDLSSGKRDRLELPRSQDRLAIYDTTGALVAGRGPSRADAATLSVLRTRRPTGLAVSGTLLVAVPLLAGERITGVVRAQRSQAAVASRAHRAWLALAGLAAAVVALAVVAALALGRRLTDPLERLAAAARRVGDGDFAARATTTGVSEIDDVVAALNSSSQRIADLIDRERTFSADASHQLRTPLAALRLELENLALEREREPAPGLTAALAQVDRLQSTIETLLAVVRGTPSGERTTDLAKLLHELEIRWHGTLAADGRPLRVRLEVKPAIATISPSVLGEIAEVLMHNAHVHGAGAVTLTARRVGDALTLEVNDQGRGFDADPEGAFARRGAEGHGIGLALARSLAHAEGARLQITHAAPAPTVSVLMTPAPDATADGNAEERPPFDR